MKTVYICPICGSRFLDFEVEALSLYDYIMCAECDNSVLPLATPQREEC